MLLALAMLLVGCSKSSTTTTATKSATPTPASTLKPQSGGTLRIIMTEFGSASLGLPWKMTGSNTDVVDLILERLLIQERSGEYTGILAQSFEWSTDYTTLILHLRHGVKFQDETDFNSAAVKWNYDQAIAAKSAGYDLITSTETPDPYTFKIHMAKYDAALLPMVTAANINSPYSYMISPTAYQKNGEDWANMNPVGTGPFKFKEYKPDNYVLTERFDDYWGGKPYLDAVKSVLIPDAVTAQLAFESGEDEAISIMGKGYLLARDLGPKGYTIDAWPDLKTSLVAASGDPNKVGVANTGPLGNELVRMAIEYAIDKQKICDTVFNGYYQPVYQYAPPILRPAKPDFVPRTYDPVKAKDLLTQAGYPNGFDTTLYCGVHLGVDEIPLIQSYLNAVGIRTTVEMTTIAKWIDMETNGWQDGLMISPTGNDPSLANYFSRFWWTPDAPQWSHGIYWTALYRPPELQAMLVNFMAEPDSAKQITMGKDIVSYISAHALAIPLWDWVSNEVMQPYLHDARYEAQQFHRWDYAHAWMELDKIKK